MKASSAESPKPIISFGNSPDRKYLAVTSSIAVWLYDAKTYQEVRFLESDGGLISVVFSPMHINLRKILTTVFPAKAGTSKNLLKTGFPLKFTPEKSGAGMTFSL